MTTKRQIESNRKNALKSTGPKTPEGRAIVGRNAIKYGLYSQEVVLKGGLVSEDSKEFEELLRGLVADFQPVGSMETIMVEKIAATCWRLKRLFRAECGSIKTNIINADKDNRFDQTTPQCPIGIHDLLSRENLSLNELIKEMMEYAEKMNLSGEEMFEDEDFKALSEEKYPKKKLDDLSVHQLKRLKSAFRAEMTERTRETGRLVGYLQKAKPQHFDSLVPGERITRYGTTLERSLLRDLSALKQLQTMRKVD